MINGFYNMQLSDNDDGQRWQDAGLTIAKLTSARFIVYWGQNIQGQILWPLLMKHPISLNGGGVGDGDGDGDGDGGL